MLHPPRPSALSSALLESRLNSVKRSRNPLYPFALELHQNMKQKSKDYRSKTIRATTSVKTCSARTNTIGQVITSYLSIRPSTLKYCGEGGPCLGPRDGRWMHKSTLFRPRLWYCICDGNGFCILSADKGHFLTRRCTCVRDCLHFPMARWRENAWNVVKVLKLSPAAQLRRPEE